MTIKVTCRAARRAAPRRGTPCFQYPVPLGQQNAQTQEIVFLNPVCPSFCNHVPTKFSHFNSPTAGLLFPSDANRRVKFAVVCTFCRIEVHLSPAGALESPVANGDCGENARGAVTQTHRHQTVGQASLLVAALTPRSNRRSIERLGIGSCALGHLVQRSHAVRPVSCAQTEHSLAVKCVFFA